MAYHNDLLEQAIDLIHYKPSDPNQAALRRAVSTAYYALFHLLISETTLNWSRDSSRDSLYLADCLTQESGAGPAGQARSGPRRVPPADQRAPLPDSDLQARPTYRAAPSAGQGRAARARPKPV